MRVHLVLVGIQELRVRALADLAARHATWPWLSKWAALVETLPGVAFPGPESTRAHQQHMPPIDFPEWFPSRFPTARERERLFTCSLGLVTWRDFALMGSCLSRRNTPVSDKRSERQVTRSIFCLCQEPKHTNAAPANY